MDCGPTCLRMIAKYYGRHYNISTLRGLSGINREGVSLLGLSEAAEKIGFRTVGAKLTWEQLKKDAEFPCIIYWDQVHFVIVYKIKNDTIYIADPAKGKVTYKKDEFLPHWVNSVEGGQKTGIVLLFYTSPAFYDQDGERGNSLSFSTLMQYVLPYKSLLFQLALGLLAGSILQLIFPFLTQAIVDIGIQNRDIHFIYLILSAQLMLFFGRTMVEFIRSWILLHMSTRINISILSDFLIKLMKLPMPFFDTKMVGDIMQRMGDHSRIQSFLTSQSLTTIFSFVNLLTFSVVLAYYHLLIFVVFLVSSVLYVIWITLFLKKRKELDHRRFGISASTQSTVIQLIQGMQEIKLNNSETIKRWEWERLQAGLFRYQVKNLALQQYQEGGAFFINEGKNIAITFISAIAVINGELTLGAMLAVQYIIGQLNGPVQQMIGFVQSLQDALISIERLNEVHEMNDEEPKGALYTAGLPATKDITIRNLWFSYPGAGDEPVLRNLNLVIPEGKITAIVGSSGSGKTTLVKILLKFYPPDKGDILVGDHHFGSLSSKIWRNSCGAVMQDGFIFSDSILRNIAVNTDTPDIHKLEHAIRLANIGSFIESLPLGLNTKIGPDGNGISQGQRQRILIARAVYKNPDFIFFDEATNALDTRNEKTIIENLQEFYQNRTVLVVAHRLSTVKNADQIVVLDKGQIVEIGTHDVLIRNKGAYFDLVSNQIEYSK